MKNMKKASGLLLALSMISFAVSGCGLPGTTSSSSSSAAETSGAASSSQSDLISTPDTEKVTLRVVDWSDSSKVRREEFNKKFMADHPNVTIEYTMLTIDQFKNTIVTSIKSGDGPDLFPVPSGMSLSTALQENWYQPMSPYLTDEFIDSIDPAAFMEGVTNQGKDIYSIPEIMPIVNTLFYYNQDVLDKAGIKELPKTYSEFIDVCKKITDAGKGQYYGFIEGGKQLNRVDTLARTLADMAGAKIAPTFSYVLTSEGRAAYDDEAVLGVFELFSKLKNDGSIHPDTVNLAAPEAREMFAQGQAAFICQGMWCIPAWAQGHPELNYGVMAPPTPDSGMVGGVPSTILAPWMGIYKQSKIPDVASEYLMALFSKDYGYQSNCVADGNYISIVKGVNEESMTNEIMKQYYNVAQAFTRVIPYAQLRDEKAYTFYTKVTDVQPSLASLLQGVIAGSVSDYKTELTKLSEASTTEWKRAAGEVGLDFGAFEFSNWDVAKDYTEADYKALK